MLFNARGVALFLGVSIAVVTTAFLSLVAGVSRTALLVTFLLSFSSAYILINVALEFLIFREITKIYRALDKLKRKELGFVEEVQRRRGNPLKSINQEIFNYAKDKQREINDLKKMEEFRRDFVANISHELKTPIFSAQGFVHTLLDGAVEQKKFRYKFLKKAAKSLDGLDLLVQDLLTLSQMETGNIKMYYEHFDMLHIVKDVFEQLEDNVEKKNMRLVINDTKARQTVVYADYNRIYQVMINLVSNAIKYTKKEDVATKGGTVTVVFESTKNTIRVLVKDQGRGIPPEDIDRVFERFYRVEKSRARHKGGTGLGLAIVKHVLEAHHTKITVTSKVGEGSTFSFVLPKGKPEEAVKRVRAAEIED